MLVPFSIKVVLQKVFLQLPCLRRNLCSMAMLVSWSRYKYDMTGGNSRSSPSIYLHYFQGKLLHFWIYVVAYWSCSLP